MAKRKRRPAARVPWLGLTAAAIALWLGFRWTMTLLYPGPGRPPGEVRFAPLGGPTEGVAGPSGSRGGIHAEPAAPHEGTPGDSAREPGPSGNAPRASDRVAVPAAGRVGAGPGTAPEAPAALADPTRASGEKGPAAKVGVASGAPQTPTGRPVPMASVAGGRGPRPSPVGGLADSSGARARRRVAEDLRDLDRQALDSILERRGSGR